MATLRMAHPADCFRHAIPGSPHRRALLAQWQERFG
jgi:hypothetical protein